MKKLYFTVGPSQVYPTLYKHLQKAMQQDIPSLNHRGSDFKELFNSTTEDLKKLLKIPANYQIFFVSSALESMERTILSCCGQTSFHLITGAFGKSWASIAAALGKNALSYKIGPDEKAELTNLDVPKNAEVICVTQNDTSAGYWIPIKEIVKLKKRYPEKLVAIDVVSSVPYVDINFKYIDIAFFSVQKGFGLPAGLGVIIVSPQAVKKTEALINKGIITGSYHCFKKLSQKANELQTPETPNVLNIYLLNAVIKDMLKTGIEKIREGINQKARLLYSFFDNHQEFKPFIKEIRFRSPTTLSIDVKGQSEKLRKKLARNGFIVGAGYGDNKPNHIRIANFPSHKLKDLESMLKHI